MSETAVTAKPVAKAAAPTEPTPMRAQKLRDVLAKKCLQNSFKSIGYKIDWLEHKADSPVTIADVMAPAYWANVAAMVAKNPLGTQHDRIGSRIIVDTPDFVADLRINAIVLDAMNNPCGLDLTCVGPAQDKNGKGCPRDVKTGMPWVDPAKAE
jgi:hypothetical protein